ncbi:MAG: PAS domain S-box protein, partial [Chitinophagaceae bacterium]
RKVEVSVQEVHAIIDSAPFPIGVYTGKEMRIRFANQSIIDVWGKGPEVIGKTYAEVLPELEGSGIYEQLNAVYTTGVPYHARNQQVNLVVDGVLQPFFFNYSFTPLYDIGGKTYGVMNTAAEITDLHLAKLQVEQSERNFRSMIVQAPVAMCILLGPEHVVDVANEAMFALWGKPVEQVMNKPIFEALPDARNQGLEKVMNAVYETGIPFYANERPVNLLRNGRMETVYQNFVYQPYNDADGKILGVIAISVDVTNQVMARQKIEQIVTQRTGELAEANAALVKGNLELMRLNANLEEFAYAASHDLKEPIRKIHFFSDRLKSELEATLSTEQKLLFDRLENASRRMGSLIDDLLAYSQAGRGLGEEEEVDLAKKVQLVLGDLELEVQQKGARVIVESLPTLRGSKRQIQQLLHNLLSNALKYSKAGTTPEIRISSALVMGGSVKPDLPKELAENTFHLVEVKDNGIGFSQEDAGRIFNVFTRLHGNAEYRGTGVGLSIAQKVVQNHGGFIWAESSEGEGATFRILLPAE